MIERRSDLYGRKGLLWVAKKQGFPDVAVIAKGKVNTWRVYGIVNEVDLYLRKEFFTFQAACAFAETLIPNP